MVDCLLDDHRERDPQLPAPRRLEVRTHARKETLATHLQSHNPEFALGQALDSARKTLNVSSSLVEFQLFGCMGVALAVQGPLAASLRGDYEREPALLQSEHGAHAAALPDCHPARFCRGESRL